MDLAPGLNWGALFRHDGGSKGNGIYRLRGVGLLVWRVFTAGGIFQPG